MNLIERVCKCGCKKTFRCLPNSKQRYISQMHKYADLLKKLESKKSSLRRGVRHDPNAEPFQFRDFFRLKSSLKE